MQSKEGPKDRTGRGHLNKAFENSIHWIHITVSRAYATTKMNKRGKAKQSQVENTKINKQKTLFNIYIFFKKNVIEN